MFDLRGRVALVTGGNGGIGLGIARGLAKAGADVVIAGRNAVKNAAARAELEAIGVRAAALAVDVGLEDKARAAVAEAGAVFGRLDILVNNAGVGSGGRTANVSTAEFRALLDINLIGVLVCSQAAYPLMRAAGGGKIINIGSMYSLFGASGVAAYAASKGAVIQLTKVLAVEWAKDNIQVNAILPGWINTDMTAAVKENPRFQADVVARTPARRWGEPSDFEGPSVFLASPASDFVTGASLVVDGGYAVKA